MLKQSFSKQNYIINVHLKAKKVKMFFLKFRGKKWATWATVVEFKTQLFKLSN